jgi:hypothetical protein
MNASTLFQKLWNCLPFSRGSYFTQRDPDTPRAVERSKYPIRVHSCPLWV